MNDGAAMDDETDEQARRRMTEAVTGFAREIADPTRFAILDLLVVEGPQTMSEIAEALQLAGPRVGNHLARLRSARLVWVERSGRHAIYRIAGPHIGEALAGLRAVVCEQTPAAGTPRRRVPPAMSALAQARSCYGHLAGRLGVSMLEYLVQRQAALAPEGVRADVAMGPSAHEVFGGLGVDLDQLTAGRRRFAFACMDWTERRPHLGGVLGGALLESLLARGLLAREHGTRALRVTAAGQAELSQVLKVRVRRPGTDPLPGAPAAGPGDPAPAAAAAADGGGSAAASAAGADESAAAADGIEQDPGPAGS